MTSPEPPLSAAELVDDLRVVLSLDVIDQTKARLLLDLTVQRVAAVVSPVPFEARPIVLDVAARAYVNPQGVTQESVGPFSRSFTTPGVYLTKRERADLRRMRGAGGAFTFNPITPVETVVVQSVVGGPIVVEP